ncbi:MAG TPA: hypothetical protein VKQ28_15855 [Candidatus Acidoferrum sp.]|nr:hypothetical protein [Candidatus Acidoferrum sp.]
MLSQAIWWSCIALECFLLARGVLGRLIVRYPVFYGYILFVATQSVLRSVVHRWYYDQFYFSVYWVTEFLGLVLGCLIVFEIYRVALAGYPGTARMARKILLFLFVLALAKAGAAFAGDPHLLTDTTPLQMERTLRTAQAISIGALVMVFAAYSIPFGKNLRGILLGYGLFIGERVICLTFVPVSGEDFWFYAYSGSYLMALGLWLGHLWCYQAIPATERNAPLDKEYQLIAAATRRHLQDARGFLRKAMGS